MKNLHNFFSFFLGNFVCLVGGSVLFYSPYRPLRITGAVLNILMQLNIMVSGNYNFFNMLSILM